MPPGKSPVGKNKNQAQQKQNSPPAARARTRSATAQGQSVAAAGAAGAPATAIKTASGFGTEATEPPAPAVQELMQAMEQKFASQMQQMMQAMEQRLTMQMRAITVQKQQVTMQMQPDKAEQQAQFHSEQMQAMEQRQAVRMQKRQADMRAQMQDMRLQPQAEWRKQKQWQETIQPELQTVQDTPAQLVQCEAQSNETPSKHYPGKLATARLQRHALTLCNEEPSKHYPGKLATARLQRHALTLRANSRVKKKRYTTSHTAVQKDVRALAARLGSLAPNVQDVMTQLETTGDTATDIRVEPTEHERRLKERDSLAPNVQAVMKQSEAAHWDVEQKHKALERAHAERCARLQAEVQKVRDLEQQQEEADGRGLLQFEAEQLRNKEELLSSKELAFANPPRISPAPWTHSSRTRDFAYEQEKMQGNDRRPPPGNTYWLSLYFDYEQEKMRGNDRRPTPGSTYWLSLYVVVAARRSSSTS
jgi:hypothetical protein